MYKGIPFPDFDPVALHLGSFGIRWYSLAYIAGICLGWLLARKLTLKSGEKITPTMFDDFISDAVIGVILGGRLGYVLFYNFGYYFHHPLEALMIWQGGMSFHGGFAGVVLAAYFFARRHKLGFFAFTDILACVAPIGIYFGRLANFVNSELYGRVTREVPWAVIFPNGGSEPRHPSQLYEAALEGILLFLVLNVLYHQAFFRKISGFVSGLFLIGYGLARVVVENFREPDEQLGFIFKTATMGQLLSLPMIAAGIAICFWSYRRFKQNAA